MPSSKPGPWRRGSFFSIPSLPEFLGSPSSKPKEVPKSPTVGPGFEYYALIEDDEDEGREEKNFSKDPEESEDIDEAEPTSSRRLPFTRWHIRGRGTTRRAHHFSFFHPAPNKGQDDQEDLSDRDEDDDHAFDNDDLTMAADSYIEYQKVASTKTTKWPTILRKYSSLNL